MIYEYTNRFCATTLCQVKAKEQELKHKLRPANAFLKAKDLNLPAVVPTSQDIDVCISLYYSANTNQYNHAVLVCIVFVLSVCIESVLHI